MSIAVTDLEPYILPPMNHFKCIPNLMTSKQVRNLWISIRKWRMHPHSLHDCHSSYRALEQTSIEKKRHHNIAQNFASKH